MKALIAEKEGKISEVEQQIREVQNQMESCEQLVQGLYSEIDAQ